MTAKEIRKALKAGQKVIFNRHIWGAPYGYERLPVVSVRETKPRYDIPKQKGQTFVKFIYDARKPSIWALVQPELDDYVSAEFPPAQPVSWEEK